MIAKAVAAAVSAFALVSASPGSNIRTDVHYPLVKRVDCDTVRGTAFRIGEDTFFTAAHVIVNPGCKIGSDPVVITHIDGGLDVAIVQAGKRKGGTFTIDCGGFVPGRWYWAVGFAKGLPYQTLVPVYATDSKITTGRFAGQRVLYGQGGDTYIPGMSGGPVMDDRGRVPGIVNASDRVKASASREMKDTGLCRD